MAERSAAVDDAVHRAALAELSAAEHHTAFEPAPQPAPQPVPLTEAEQPPSEETPARGARRWVLKRRAPRPGRLRGIELPQHEGREDEAEMGTTVPAAEKEMQNQEEDVEQ